MSIKFACSCGKHLRAPDRMAARRIMCPRCGSPVGVPSLQPTHPGTTVNPMTPEERRRHARQRPPAPRPAAEEEGVRAAILSPAVADTTTLRPDGPAPAPRPADPAALVGLRRKQPRRREARWYDCLAYPFRACPLVLGLGLAWAVWLGCPVALLPDLQPTPSDVRPLAVLAASWLVATLVLAGPTWGFLDCALAAAAAGEITRVRWPGNDLRLMAKSVVRWLLALLAGPAEVAAVAFRYWLHGGDLGPLDWLILAELAGLAIAWWVFAVAAADTTDRLRDVNPLAAARLAYRLGYGGLVVLVAAGVAVALGYGTVRALAESHGNALAGVWVAWCAVVGLFLATALFRLVGMWLHRDRAGAGVAPPAAG